MHRCYKSNKAYLRNNTNPGLTPGMTSSLNIFTPSGKVESDASSQLAARRCRWSAVWVMDRISGLMGAKFPRIAYTSSSSGSSSGCFQPTVQSAAALPWLSCSLAQGRQIGSIWRRKVRPTQTGKEDKRPGTGGQRGKPEEEAFLISLNGSRAVTVQKHFLSAQIYPEPP